MSDLKQNEDGTVAIEGNTLVLVEGADEVQQSLTQRLKTVLGEWFLDVTIGIPYFDETFMQDVEFAEAIIKREILATPGVQEILSFNFDPDPSTRITTVSFWVKAYDDPIFVEVRT